MQANLNPKVLIVFFMPARRAHSKADLTLK